MIIAIIMDHYEEVKAASGHAETLWEEGAQMIYRWKGIRAGTYVPLDRVLDAVNDEMRRTRLAQKNKTGRMGGMRRMMSKKDLDKKDEGKDGKDGEEGETEKAKAEREKKEKEEKVK